MYFHRLYILHTKNDTSVITSNQTNSCMYEYLLFGKSILLQQKSFLRGQIRETKKIIFKTFMFLQLIRFFSVLLLQFFFSILSKTQTQEKHVQDIKNKENPSPSLPSIFVCLKILQKDLNKQNSDLLIYTRTHEKRYNLPITPLQNPPKSIRDGRLLEMPITPTQNL